MPDNDTPRTRAQQAQDAYNQRGEFARIAFLISNVHSHHPESLWLQHGEIAMADGSRVRRHPDRYQISGPNESQTTLPASMTPDQRPGCYRQPNSIFTWPTAADVADHFYQETASAMGFEV